jgi:hypothetical protein
VDISENSFEENLAQRSRPEKTTEAKNSPQGPSEYIKAKTCLSHGDFAENGQKLGGFVR